MIVKKLTEAASRRSNKIRGDSDFSLKDMAVVFQMQLLKEKNTELNLLLIIKSERRKIRKAKRIVDWPPRCKFAGFLSLRHDKSDYLITFRLVISIYG